jgi:hypothetical protein
MQALIKQAGRGAYIYSTDLSRAYICLPLEVTDWPLCCLKVGDHFFIDVSIAFGLRWGAMACQRTTDVVSHVMKKQGHKVINYIDDFGGVAPSLQAATQGFNDLQDCLQELGLEENKAKAARPATLAVFLGLEFNTINMTMSIPPGKLQDTMLLVQQWLHRTTATTSQLKSILGKLFHVAQCCKPARLFLGRMLATLREAPPSGHVQLDEDFRRDLNWFREYLPLTNGVYMMELARPNPANIFVDSCTTGAGGLYADQCYHLIYPTQVVAQQLSICHLEMLNCLVALRLWAPRLHRRHVNLYCDSMVTVNVLQSGRGRDKLLLKCARHIWLVCAQHQLELNVIHEPGAHLTHTADALSRLHLGKVYEERVALLVAQRALTFRPIHPGLFQLLDTL